MPFSTRRRYGDTSGRNLIERCNVPGASGKSGCLEHDVYWAWGWGGQLVFCVPALQLVVAANHYYNVSYPQADAQEQAMLRLIVNCLAGIQLQILLQYPEREFVFQIRFGSRSVETILIWDHTYSSLCNSLVLLAGRCWKYPFQKPSLRQQLQCSAISSESPSVGDRVHHP